VKVLRESIAEEVSEISEVEQEYEFKGTDSIGIQLIKKCWNRKTPKNLKVKNIGTIPSHQRIKEAEEIPTQTTAT
jgi:hypothetical protein